MIFPTLKLTSQGIQHAGACAGSTGITVDGIIGVTVAYQTGQWEVDADDDDDVPYDANGSQMMEAIDGAPLPYKALGALVGRIGTSGQPFWVGDGPTTLPKGQSGMLQLATNTDLSKDLSSNVGNVTVFIYPEITVADLSTPLVSEPPQSIPGVPTEGLGPLAYLIGTWTNQPLGSSGKGGTDSPFSYNVMWFSIVDDARNHPLRGAERQSHLAIFRALAVKAPGDRQQGRDRREKKASHAVADNEWHLRSFILRHASRSHSKVDERDSHHSRHHDVTRWAENLASVCALITSGFQLPCVIARFFLFRSAAISSRRRLSSSSGPEWLQDE